MLETPSPNDMLYSLRLIMEAVVSFFQRLPQPILTFAGFFCFGGFMVTSAGLLFQLLPVMSLWQAGLAYVLWAASVGTVLLHWDF
jgi:hypothetical protein